MKYLTTIFIILICFKLPAQTGDKFKLGIYSGYNFCKQKDLKNLNQNPIDYLPFEVNTIDDFGPSFHFGGYFQYRVSDHFYIGPSYEYKYSGSRIGTRDYSGMYSLDQYVHVHQTGVKISYSWLSTTRIILMAEANAGVNFTGWRVDEKLVIGYASEKLQNKFNGLSWQIEPALKFEYKLIPHVYVWGSAAYSFDMIRRYKRENSSDYDKIESPNWSGMKVSLGLEFQFN